ncbi:hypothetical protein [Oceanobacillus senegalensis]|nr:hypothetical protein [Oceanobacillus senegalensis]
MKNTKFVNSIFLLQLTMGIARRVARLFGEVALLASLHLVA